MYNHLLVTPRGFPRGVFFAITSIQQKGGSAYTEPPSILRPYPWQTAYAAGNGSAGACRLIILARASSRSAPFRVMLAWMTSQNFSLLLIEAYFTMDPSVCFINSVGFPPFRDYIVQHSVYHNTDNATPKNPEISPGQKYFFTLHFATVRSQISTHHNILCPCREKPENPCYHWGFGDFSFSSKK